MGRRPLTPTRACSCSWEGIRKSGGRGSSSWRGQRSAVRCSSPGSRAGSLLLCAGPRAPLAARSSRVAAVLEATRGCTETSRPGSDCQLCVQEYVRSLQVLLCVRDCVAHNDLMQPSSLRPGSVFLTDKEPLAAIAMAADGGARRRDGGMPARLDDRRPPVRRTASVFAASIVIAASIAQMLQRELRRSRVSAEEQQNAPRLRGIGRHVLRGRKVMSAPNRLEGPHCSSGRARGAAAG